MPAGCPATRPHTAVFTGAAGEWIDLSHAFGPSTIYWPTDTAGFQLTELAYGHTEAGFFYASYAFSSAEHGGTHLDAPIHFAEGRMTADAIPLSSLITTASVVDVSGKAAADPDYQLAVEDLTAWEAEHGELVDGTAVLVRTGWSSRWGTARPTWARISPGPRRCRSCTFPGSAPRPRSGWWTIGAVAAVGIDTPSIDYGQSSDFRAHVILYERNIVGFENLTNLERLPATGAGIVALPMKIEGGSGGPLRVVGWVG